MENKTFDVLNIKNRSVQDVTLDQISA